MSSPRHVSVRQIAAQAGVSHATVSLALRGSPRLSVATREHVRTVAEGMGWRPNPTVAAWMAHRRSIVQPKHNEGIAFLNSWPDPSEWATFPWMTRYVDGARARAAELGYTFDEIHCASMGMGKRLQKVLFTRGIRAVLIGSQHGDSPKPELDWTQLATVAQSYTVTGLNVSRALNNYFLSMRTAMAELMALGYRRIGYARTPHIEERTRYTNVSAYLGVQAEQARRDRVELLDWTKPDQSLLASWLKRERPDALITHDARLSGILSQIGVRVPEDLGVALLSLHPGWEERFPEIEGQAGIDQRLELCGGVAVDLLVSRISQNELGLPAEPVLALTEGVWLPGGSVRQK